MPITSVVQGNLVTRAQEGKYSAIVHGANCFCTFGSGLAPQIAKAWPQAEEADSLTTVGDDTKLGKYTLHHDTDVNMFVFNLYTQYDFGRDPYSVDYTAVRDGFARLNHFLPSITRNTDEFIRPVGIPMIGAGLAGGHWEAYRAYKLIDKITQIHKHYIKKGEQNEYAIQF